MFEEMIPIAARIAAALVARGETVAVADGATGGLISAALLAIPGASKFYRGGGVVYTFRARDVLFALPSEAYEGMTSATEPYALLQARAIRDNFRSHWGLAETGASGGSAHPLGVASGRSCAAVVGPGAERARITETASDLRADNMFAFTRAALLLLEETLAGLPASDQP
jgi:nicotinamide-nucleotide amidase